MPYIPTMPNYRIYFAVGMACLIPLAAWAQNPGAPAVAPGVPAAPQGSVEAATAKAAAAVVEPPTEAELTLDAAAKKLVALKSVSADISEKVEMLEQKFDINGRYLKAPGNRMLLRLKVSGLADADGIMQQVCDGQVLWDFQQVLQNQSYQRLDIGQVFEKLRAPEIDEALRLQITTQLGFSGPDELIVGLRRAIKFDQKTAGTHEGKAVWVITGTWKNRNGLLGPNAQPLPLTAPLPSYVPSLVTIRIGQEDGWPYKLVLVGKVPTVLMDSRPKGQDGRPLGSPKATSKENPTRIELTYSNVQLNPSIKADEFAFQPPSNAQVEDRTTQLITMLDQRIQMIVAQKKADASKGEEPLLKESIKIPGEIK